MKVERIDSEIIKTKAKITEYQNRLRDLEKQKTETENTEIVALVRGMDIPRTELAAILAAMRQGRGLPSDGKNDDEREPD